MSAFVYLHTVYIFICIYSYSKQCDVDHKSSHLLGH